MTRWAIACALGLASACVMHRGPGWHVPAHTASIPTDAPYSLVAIGNPGVPGRGAAHVATRLRDVLAHEREAGRRPIVLMLGDLVLPARPRRDVDPAKRRDCPDPATAWARAGSSDLHDVMRDHLRDGGDVFAVIGGRDRACGFDEALRQADPSAGPHPWTMPDDHYVVRVDRDGAAQIVSRCDDDVRCRIATADDGAILDLVVVDATAWMHPPSADSPWRARADRSVQRLSALVDAVAMQPGPPRVLVSAVPIEAPGVHGHGGRFSDATFHNLPPTLKDAIAAGTFVGSIGAYDRALAAAPDLTDAIKRSDKVWVRAPIFQLVSGSASWPDARVGAGARRLRYFRGNAYRPPIYSDHLGFVVVRPVDGAAQAELWARRRGRWQTDRLPLSLTPAPHPLETRSPVMTPCADCQPIPAGERQ